MEELFVELVIKDTAAATAKQCLQEMGLQIEDVHRYDYYRFSADTSLVKDLMNMDIIANVNKHRCRMQLPSGWKYVFVRDTVQGGLLNTLKKLGLQVTSIEKGVVWGLKVHDERSVVEAAEKLLCNKHYQRHEIRHVS